MSAQLTSETLNQWLSMSSLAAVIAGVPPEVALGALAGAVIFVTSAVEYPIRRRVLLSMLSFLCGLLFYKPAASILIGIASLIPTITQDSFEKGIEIKGLDQIQNTVFHMGTVHKEGKWYNNGGRVLFVVGEGDSLQDAQKNAYEAVSKITSDNLFYRKDIGWQAIKVEQND